MMHYLVTGGAGFIGSHLCDALLAAGHKLTVVDDLSTGHRSNLSQDVAFIEGDCGDRSIIKPLMQEVDGVFHLAAIASVQRSREQWFDTSMTNQMATVALLEAIKHSGRTIPFVYASSAAVYGDPDESLMPLQETTPMEPLTPYGADKAGCELHANVAAHVFGIPTIGLRFFNIFGPRQDPSSPYSGVISIFVNRISNDESVTIFGDGEQTRDFVYVADVVEHLNAAMQGLHTNGITAGSVFNVCGGRTVSVNQLADVIAEVCGVTAKKEYNEPRVGDIRYSQGDNAKATQALGVKATIALKDGLKQTVDWMRGYDNASQAEKKA